MGGALLVHRRHEADAGGGKQVQRCLLYTSRVFSAFFLACATAIPVGILMGVNRYARGIFDPVSYTHLVCVAISRIPPRSGVESTIFAAHSATCSRRMASISCFKASLLSMIFLID